MNEREAIQFIMEELKESRRKDFEMYFELRKETTATYDRYLNRLREIDERDMDKETPKITIETPRPQITVMKPANPLQERRFKTESKYIQQLQESFEQREKELPEARSAHMSQQEMRVDRVREEEPKHEPKRRALVPDEMIVPAIEQFLKEQGMPVKLGMVRTAMESKFDVKWSNFGNIMKRAMDVSPFIHVDKVGLKDFKYSYKEV